MGSLVDCTICRGAGTITPRDDGSCPVCFGKGRYAEDYVPPAIVSCRACEATGKLRAPVTCFDCGGSGRVPAERYG